MRKWPTSRSNCQENIYKFWKRITCRTSFVPTATVFNVLKGLNGPLSSSIILPICQWQIGNITKKNTLFPINESTTPSSKQRQIFHTYSSNLSGRRLQTKDWWVLLIDIWNQTLNTHFNPVPSQYILWPKA